jgi:flap endonuclease-1
MGIKQLSKLIGEHAPSAIKEISLEALNGRKIAIDASMQIYQFLVAVRSDGGGGGPSSSLTNEAGEVTSHLQGMWYRTLRFVEAGIKPVYVFDGKPPTLKGGELAKRKEAKDKAQKDLAAATEAGNVEDMERFSKRTVHMTKDHIADCMKLIRLMGMPVVEAPCEAEAQCAELAKAGLVYGAASEDMDTLTFGTPKLIRKMFATAESKIPVLEFDHKKILDGFEMTNDQFIDVCILAGCDYCDTIKGVAATTAFKLIKQHGNLEEVLKNVDKEKIPKDVDYDEVRKLFVTPEVTEASKIELKWGEPDREGLIQFLVTERQFNPERINKGIDKLMKARAGGQQMRMDSFFKPMPVDSSSSSKKRKVEEPPPKKGGKGGEKKQKK